MRKGHWKSYALLDGLPDVNVFAILEDREGCLWFGTDGGGVSRHDGDSFVAFTTKDGLAGNKALKGIYSRRFEEVPPRSHNLLYLAEKTELELPTDLYDFIFTINRVSVPTRYPDDLRRVLEDHNKERTEEILRRSKEVLKWLKAQL